MKASLKTIYPPKNTLYIVHIVHTRVTSTHVLDAMYLWPKTIYSAGVRFC